MIPKGYRLNHGVLLAYLIAWMVGYTVARADGLSIAGAFILGLMFDACVCVIVAPAKGVADG